MELDSFFLRICISNGRFWTAFCSLSNDLNIIEILVVIIKAYRNLALKIDTVDVHTSMHKRKLYAIIYARKRRLFFVCDYETDAKCPQMDQQTSKSAVFNGFRLYLLTKLSFRAIGT